MLKDRRGGLSPEWSLIPYNNSLIAYRYSFLSDRANVEKYAPDDTTKQLLLRATWIGNDYAHYETKHEEINLNDLKSLINLSVEAIEKDIKVKNYIANIEHK